jgi:hypothetical protein
VVDSFGPNPRVVAMTITTEVNLQFSPNTSDAVPGMDAAFFAYLGAHGGAAFRRAVGFVGLDVYPGSIYPPVVSSGSGYRAALAQALGVVGDCLSPMARIRPRVPIWVTENGVPTGSLTESRQAAALSSLVRAASDYARADNVTDYLVPPP